MLTKVENLKRYFMLDTQETAEGKYNKWEKDPAPAGWDADPFLVLDFGCISEEVSAHGNLFTINMCYKTILTPKVSEEKIHRMIQELKASGEAQIRKQEEKIS
ncbi:hypothetical protein Dimus_026178 [Dionaea muscipula]